MHTSTSSKQIHKVKETDSSESISLASFHQVIYKPASLHESPLANTSNQSFNSFNLSHISSTPECDHPEGPYREDSCGTTDGQSIFVSGDPPDLFLEVRMETWVDPAPESPELVVNLLLSNEIPRLLRLISQAYLSSLPNIHVLMENQFPNFVMDTLPISCMIWNVHGAASTNAFLASLKKLIRMHKPNVLALVETYMQG